MKASRSVLAAILCTTWLALNSSNSAVAKEPNSLAKILTASTDLTQTAIMNDEIFQHVPLETEKQTVCSPPDPGFDWRGIAIRAPSRIVLPEKSANYSHLIIPICGLYLVNVASTFQYPGPKLIIVTDEESGQIYKSPLVRRIADPIVPSPRSRPVNPSSKAAFGEYFNVNAATYVTVPMKAGRYRVKIEYAGYQSNEVVITLVERS